MAEQSVDKLAVAPCVLESLPSSKLAPVVSGGADNVLDAEDDKKDILAQDMAFNRKR